MDISIIILILVFLTIMMGKLGKFYIPMWQSMGLGAIFLLAIGKISLKTAWESINWKIIFFLTGMFIVGYASEKSGFLIYIASKVINKAKNYRQMIFTFTMLMGILSSLLMNDTIAIIGTSLFISYSKIYNLSADILLYLLAFSITSGSIFSPIGNPQNLLIALNPSFENGFLGFLLYLTFPTFLNLYILYKIFYKIYPASIEIRKIQIDSAINENYDRSLYKISMFSFYLIIILIIIKILSFFIKFPFHLELESISIISGSFVLIFSKRRWEILKNIDWYTILFFAGMFIVMRAVWDSGFFQNYITKFEINFFSIFFLSTFLSQLISNVPLVTFFMKFIDLNPDSLYYLALACSSTFAGNLTVLGAASNIIIFQNAYQKGIYLSPWKFLRLGIFITAINFITFLGYFYMLRIIINYFDIKI